MGLVHSALQTALRYLKATHVKDPELVQKEESGDSAHGKLDLSGQIIQGGKGRNSHWIPSWLISYILMQPSSPKLPHSWIQWLQLCTGMELGGLRQRV